MNPKMVVASPRNFPSFKVLKLFHQGSECLCLEYSEFAFKGVPGAGAKVEVDLSYELMSAELKA